MGGPPVTYVPTTFPKWRQRYPQFFETVDLVLCESPHMASHVAALGCTEHKLRVHHLGISPGYIRRYARERCADRQRGAVGRPARSGRYRESGLSKPSSGRRGRVQMAKAMAR